MLGFTSMTHGARRARRWLGLSAVPAFVLVAILSCGESAPLLAPEPASGPTSGIDAGSSTASIEPGLLPPLPLIDDLFDFSTDGVLRFVQLPDLSLTRRTGKWIRAAEGGFVELNGFRVDIPAGALARDTFVTVSLPATLPEALYVVAEFGPTGTTFRKPVKVTLPLRGVSLSGVDPTSVNVSYWDGSTWVSHGGRATSSSVSAGTTHFSTYGARAKKGGADTAAGG